MNKTFEKLGFYPADILLPKDADMTKWAVVACDQFTSQPEYWQAVEETVGDAPSTLWLILPEANLKAPNVDEYISGINAAMEQYLKDGVFQTLEDSLIYVERQQSDGRIRHGLIGMVDLDAYDFTPGSGALIRATEGTVLDRIPPRARVRRGAPIELPHVMLLIDDPDRTVIEPLTTAAGTMEKLYDFDLMENGGRIRGYLISGMGVSLVNSAVSRYISATEAAQNPDNAMSFAIGDGNHSLAAAKSCWEELKSGLTEEERLNHPARYALVELENIHDAAIEFEPIHRVVKGEHLGELMNTLRAKSVPDGYPITMITGSDEETIYLSKDESPLALAILQPILDEFAAKTGATMDYIHGEDVTRELSKAPNTLGLIVPGMAKESLFPGVLQGGVLPRKTFSMGQANEKRYYLEGKMRA